ncbi:MAG TPA: MCP four helix bundle domain-containing protein, partial [Fibrobacteria bacterium]|nr:MCP four helix bundle domain-containing protein [Fibrobacteria bacterium]
MFKNLKIGVKIGVGFFLILAMVGVLVLIARDRLDNINVVVDRVVTDRNVKVAQAHRLKDNINEISRIVRNLVITHDRETLRAENVRLDGVVKAQGDVLDTLQSTIKSDEGKRLLADVVKAREEYSALREKLTRLGLANDDSACSRLMFGDFRTVQNEYMKAVDNLISYQTELTNADGREAAADGASLQQLLLLLGLGMVALSVLLAWYITTSITKPIGQCISIADQIANGKTDMAIDLD